MSNLFAAISGKFSTALLTGTSLPILLSLMLYVWVIEPVTKAVLPVPAEFRALDTQWKVLVLTFALALFTGVLGASNHVILSLYCGAYWDKVPPGSLLARFHLRRRARLQQLSDRLDALGDSDNPDTLTQSTGMALKPVLALLHAHYPLTRPTRPTRLGNVVANREDYFKGRYGIDHSIAWWRLAPLIETSCSAALDDLKAGFDFMLNSSFLAGLLVTWLLIYCSQHRGDPNRFLPIIAALALIARFAYLGAVDRMRALGNMQCAAIDLYRLPMLAKLGLKYEFISLADEREVWESLEQSLAFPGRNDGSPYQRQAAISQPTSATSNSASLTIVRSNAAFTPGRFPSATIELLITNATADKACDVRIADQIPAGWMYITASAASSFGNIGVTATSPLQMKLDLIAPYSAINVNYRIQAWKVGSL